MRNEKGAGTRKFKFSVCGLIIAAFFAALLAGCQPASDQTTVNVDINSSNRASNANNQAETANQPVIEAAPVQAGENDYQIITAEDLKLTVRAPGAESVELFYQPITTSDRAIRFKTIDQKSGEDFTAELKTPEDFNGEVWAEARYSNGETKETERLRLAVRDAVTDDTNKERAQNQTNREANSSNSANSNQTAAEQSSDTDDSARADKLTGGKIERAALKAGNSDVRITVNVPAFLMTLWQNGKEIATYPVGVGRKAYPIPIGLRSADKIILNPNWIPPDSDWVRKSGVEPYQKIPASDPDNPLGKIKIPLGNAYLLHEAQSRSDLGSLVSHGCVRVLREDIFDLTEKIARARNLDVSASEINAAKKNSERRVIDLKGEIPVDINYDTMVVEDGKLRLYPDVYERDTNTMEKLRAELRDYEVDESRLEEKTLREMLDKISRERVLVVSLKDIKAGNALANSETEPLIKSSETTKKRS